MRILLYNDKRAERESMLRALPAESYRVEAVGDEQAALAAITRDSPQVIVFAVPVKGGPDLARRLKGADASGQAYLVAVFDAAPLPKDIANLISMGVNDFVRRPVLDAELVERVKSPGRLIRWAQSVLKPAAFDFSAALDLCALRAWKNFGALVAEDLSQIAGQSFGVSDGWPEHFSSGLHSATIPMSLAGDELEVRVSIVMNSTTLDWLRASVLADPLANKDATDDALREFANTAGGAIKRAVLCENVALTTGIPVNDSTACFPGKHQCWTLTLEAGGCTAIVAEIRKRENQRVQASKLAEGMVLAHDVRNEGGVLLVPAGSRLTGTSAAKLAAMLGPKFFLEVAQAG